MNHAPLTDSRLSHAASEFVWDIDDGTDNHEHIAAPLLNLLERQRAGAVLDLGCGNGALTARLAAGGFQVEGCDRSSSGLEIARRVHPDIPFRHMDLALPLPEELRGRYDAVIAAEVIEHLLLPRQLMAAALAALRPGGLLVVTTPFHGFWKNLALAMTNKFDDHWHPLRDYGHVKFFSKATLTSLFSEFPFEDAAVRTVGRVPFLARSMIVSARKSVVANAAGIPGSRS